MYRKFRNIPVFKDFPLICPYFLGFRVCRYAIVLEFHSWHTLCTAGFFAERALHIHRMHLKEMCDS